MPDEQANCELDARVAVEVMGWRRSSRRSDHSNELWWDGLGEDSGITPLRPFSTDPTADYKVLKVAREWPSEKKEAFCEALLDIWCCRSKTHGRRFWPLALYYEPGDYSRAALDVPPEPKTPLEPQPSKG